MCPKKKQQKNKKNKKKPKPKLSNYWKLLENIIISFVSIRFLLYERADGFFNAAQKKTQQKKQNLSDNG